MSRNAWNNILALWWLAVIVLLGIFVYDGFGWSIGKWVINSVGQKPVFIFYIASVFALLVFWIERVFCRPSLGITIGAINESPDGSLRFLHVNIVNLDWPRWFFMFRRSTAENTKAEIVFKERDFRKIIFSIEGRWSTNLEPLRQDLDEVGFPRRIYDLELARIGGLADISPSRSSQDLREGKLVVAVKLKDDNECYGFNNESYAEGIKRESAELQRGMYDIEVIIRSGGVVVRREFILENLGNDLKSMTLKNK